MIQRTLWPQRDFEKHFCKLEWEFLCMSPEQAPTLKEISEPSTVGMPGFFQEPHAMVGTWWVGTQLAVAVLYHEQLWNLGWTEADQDIRQIDGGLLLRQPPIPVQHGHPPGWELDSKRSGISTYPTPTPTHRGGCLLGVSPHSSLLPGASSRSSFSWKGSWPGLSRHHGSCPSGKWTSLIFITWIMLTHRAENGVTALTFLYAKWSYCSCELLINLYSQLCIFPWSHLAQSELLLFQKAWDGCPPKTVVSNGKRMAVPFWLEMNLTLSGGEKKKKKKTVIV